MGTKLNLSGAGLLLVLLLTFNIQPSTAHAQGSLTPPGAPAPTMLTLSQIEPRTPVDAANTPGNSSAEFVITNPGSYYLTANITGISGKDGINIGTNDVTLDLNGFLLQGGGGNTAGISILSGANNCTVRNGIVNGWYQGVATSSPDTIIENLRLAGCTNPIFCPVAAYPSVVRDCLCESNGVSTTSNIIFTSGGLVSKCVIVNNNGTAIDLFGCGSVSDCLVAGNTGYGITALGSNQRIIDNSVVTNQNVGILINGNNNWIEHNQVSTPSGISGIEVSGGEYTNNVIDQNSVVGDGAGNYAILGNNDIGPIGSASTNTSPWANISH
jgi:hypothetical protein